MSRHPHRLQWKIRNMLCALVCAGMAGAFGVPAAYAQNVGSDVMNGMVAATGVLLTVMDIMTWIFFWLLNIVTNPAFIFDTVNGGVLLNTIYQIWAFSRDMVNLGLAFVFIAAAIMTVIRANTTWVKELLPKFLIALVAVNFSWFIPRALFDISQILTSTIYDIPSIIGAANKCTTKDANGNVIDCEVVKDVRFFNVGGAVDNVNGWKCPLDGILCYQLADANDQINTDTYIFNGLIVNHARLRTLARSVEVPGNQPGVTKLLIFFVKMALVVVLHVAILFPLAAITIGFFIRIPILWLTMAFMPFVALWYVIGDKLPAGLESVNAKKQIQDRFLAAVFLPAMVAVPFAVGFVIINAGNAMIPPPIQVVVNNGGNIVNAVLPLFPGVNSFWELLWMILGLMVLWVGVFTVLESNEITKKVSTSIKGMGENLAGVAWRAPLSIPLPIGLKGADGKRQDISPLQALRGLSPAAMNQSLKYGNTNDAFKNFRNQDEAAKNAKGIKDGTVTTIKVHIDEIVKPGNAADSTATQDALTKVLAELKKDLPRLNDRQIIEAYIAKKKNMDPAERAKIEEAFNKKK